MARNGDRLAHPGRTPERIRADLEDARLAVAASVDALRGEVARAVDWRAWYRRHTGAFLIGAFAVGLIIGSRKKR